MSSQYQVSESAYRFPSGWTASREDGETKNGNPIDWRWVLRDATGKWIDVDKYRHDLFERYDAALRAPGGES